MKKPVDSIKHKEDKRAAIPSTEREGMEAPATAGMAAQSAYKLFAHDFTRGRDPELYWVDKYKNDDEDRQAEYLRTDVRSLYVHEDISPEYLISQLYDMKREESPQLELFGTPDDIDDVMERVAKYYQHEDNWQNRLILGDSLMVMNSLLNRENMKGRVQCIYMDPPYGINYSKNWQININSTNVKDTDDGVSIEPEMIKAYRDTWELGIHSYLSYLRDRLIMARELLTESGSCFVQISDENVHLVRTVMDEVFGSENFVSQIVYTKTSGFTSNTIANVCDFIIWYAKDYTKVKYRPLFKDKDFTEDSHYNQVELDGGLIRPLTKEENEKRVVLPKGAKVFRLGDLSSQGSASEKQPFEFDGKIYYPPVGRHWSVTEKGLSRLKDLGRIVKTDNNLQYKRYFDDFPYIEENNIWDDVHGIQSRKDRKVYVVQTSPKAIQRCILMTTDPGDLVLDPTCGSGTTAFVSEQWGRRWITIDTSRIALNIAKRRLTTTLFPYYVIHENNGISNIRLGFEYNTATRITQKGLAYNEDMVKEILYDKPKEDKKRIRVSGPFTVETLQGLDIVAPKDLDDDDSTSPAASEEDDQLFMLRVFDHLQSGGIKNGAKEQKAVMHGMEAVGNPYLNARGYYTDDEGRERLVYFLIGPKYGTVSKQQVNKALQEMIARQGEGASWLVILGFSFEDNIENQTISFAGFQMTKVRMGDDLLQEGLLKKDKKAASFIIIGEPDIALVKDEGGKCHVEIRGLDMYDPIKNMVKERSVAEIAYWEMDSDYSGNRFQVKSIHFCGGKKDEFDAWRKGLTSLKPRSTKKGIEHTLRMEFNEEIWDSLYDYRSEPLDYVPGRKVAVRVVSQFGEESTKVITM